MKLLTYNFLTSKCIRGVQVGYPLLLTVVDKKVEQQSFNQEFVSRMLPRLDWSAVKLAAETLGCGQDFPDEFKPESMSSDTDLLQKLHHLLLEIEVVNGSLTCPESGRVFPINNGIPNMLLNENEI